MEISNSVIIVLLIIVILWIYVKYKDSKSTHIQIIPVLSTDTVIVLPNQTIEISPNMKILYSENGTVCLSYKTTTYSFENCIKADIPSNVKHYLALDGYRIDVYVGNPVRGQTGYTVLSSNINEFTSRMVPGSGMDKMAMEQKIANEFSNEIRTNQNLNQYKLLR